MNSAKPIPRYAADRRPVSLADEIVKGLTKSPQKELPSTYLYDEAGSALFSAITKLPEYGLTRADERLLRRFAPAIASLVPDDVCIAELGSGTGEKTRCVLEVFYRKVGKPLYYSIDVSAAAQATCVRELSPVAQVETFEGTYLEGLEHVARRRKAGRKLLVLFLGSTIGNFDRPDARLEFLRAVRAQLVPGDALLLGADLVKPVAQLLAAYDDPIGVTAAFNRNLLGRINREFDGDFDPRGFDHEARYNQSEHRVEMHLRARREHEVHIRGLGLKVHFAQGETIWTESSHKFTVAGLKRLARSCGFEQAAQWVDAEWPFAENLWIAVREEAG